LGDRKDIRPVKKTGCWFVGDDDLSGAVLQYRMAKCSIPVLASLFCESSWFEYLQNSQKTEFT